MYKAAFPRGKNCKGKGGCLVTEICKLSNILGPVFFKLAFYQMRTKRSLFCFFNLYKESYIMQNTKNLQKVSWLYCVAHNTLNKDCNLIHIFFTVQVFLSLLYIKITTLTAIKTHWKILCACGSLPSQITAFLVLSGRRDGVLWAITPSTITAVRKVLSSFLSGWIIPPPLF